MKKTENIDKYRAEFAANDQVFIDLLQKLLYTQLATLGLWTIEELSVREACVKFDIQPKYHNWLEESLRLLAQAGFIQFDKDIYRPLELANSLNIRGLWDGGLWDEWNATKKSWLKYGTLAAYVPFLEETLTALPDILTGKRLATEVIFPNSSMALVEGVYKDNQEALYANQALALTLVSYIEELLADDEKSIIKILEIGAGTGGTTSVILKALKKWEKHIGEYCYSDVSPAFLTYGEQSYSKDRDFLSYKIFDISRDPQAQEINCGDYDIVIAANVLHATVNIVDTLRNAKFLLKKNGLLLLNEINRKTAALHLTFGLLDGWWGYTDSEVRVQGFPGLSSKSWQFLLEKEGFFSVFFPTGPHAEDHYQIIAAQSDGQVRHNSQSTKRVSQVFTSYKSQSPQLASDNLREQSIAYFIKVVADVTKFSPAELSASDELERVGIDSILVLQLSKALSEKFENTSPTIFYRCKTIADIADYFLANNYKELIELLAPDGALIVNKYDAAQTVLDPIQKERLREESVSFVKSLIAETAKIPLDEFKSSDAFFSIGIDSIIIPKLSRAMSLVLSDISSTTFFQYPSVDELVDHLLMSQPEKLVVLVKFNDKNKDVRTDDISQGWDASISSLPPQVTRKNITNQRGEAADTSIAIIGCSGRYPGARKLSEFWDNLKKGENCISEVPLQRWSLNPDTSEDIYTRWGGFIDGVDQFDPLFFQISPNDAITIDPQERLFLQEAYACISDAGYIPNELSGSGRVGVFVGVMNSDYAKKANHWSIANRVSYHFNYHGPSVAIDTACSSSLTALHFACESIKAGDCSYALVGGVNLILDPEHYRTLCKKTMLSKGNRCSAFGDEADGFVVAEGVGAILLKSLESAIADRDPIIAVIRATSLNSGGKTNGYTVPNPTAQYNLIKECIEKANINAAHISYLEAHGTGTALGDPIEIAGLCQAFEQHTNKKEYCALGSVKSNIGHSESAAGIAGLTKVLLQIHHQQLVPSLHASKPNNEINFSNTPFKVQQQLENWHRPTVIANGETVECPLVAGVSSFGAGGSNAHVIVEEFVSENEPASHFLEESTSALITLSAKSRLQLTTQIQELLSAIHDIKSAKIAGIKTDIRDIAYTLQLGREQMKYRFGTIVHSVDELIKNLQFALDENIDGSSIFFGSIEDNKWSKFGPDNKRLNGLVEKWIIRNKRAALLRLWTRGVNVDWKKLYLIGADKELITPRRARLPSYPFSTESYWQDVERIYQPSPVAYNNYVLESSTAALNEPVEISSVAADTKTILSRTINSLKLLLKDYTGLSTDQIDETSRFENYGVDSLMINYLNKKLESIFGLLSKTLFFEYSTLALLAEHLVKNHREGCIKWTGVILHPSDSIMLSSAKVYKNQTSQRFVARTEEESGQKDRSIAIIGMSGCFPEAPTLETFWKNIEAGKNSITEIQPSRWPLADFFDSDVASAVAGGKSYSKWGGFIENFDYFDSLFFGISPREAITIDPQERLFIQSCWEVLERAGYTRSQIAKRFDKRIAVFAGITQTGFDLYGPQLWERGEFVLPRTNFGSLANRVSYLFDFNGPSIPVDTHCSSSLVAVHLACEQLANGDCEMALAGGVNLFVHPVGYVDRCARNMLSADGQCKSFGKDGNGYVPGEGVGVILLKRLDKAIADGDQIHAVIKGTSVNHGGKTSGFTVPNPVAQAGVIRHALDIAQIDARAVGYIEAHGTGTPLGDPIEITGLSQAFHQDTDEKQFCRIGSVKSNIGHLEAAAGIAGLMKVVLQMQNKKLVPSLNVAELNPNIDFTNSPFKFQYELENWERPRIVIDGKEQEHPLTAGVSSFGAGGTNAHIVLQEYVDAELLVSHREIEFSDINPAVILVSAKNEARLQVYLQRLLNYVKDESLWSNKVPTNNDLYNIAYTLQVGRDAMDYRAAILATSTSELIEKLTQLTQEQTDITNVFLGQKRQGEKSVSFLKGDDVFSESIDKWISNGNYSILVELWVRGHNIDWEQLYSKNHYTDVKPRRVVLPTYPFSSDRHWFSDVFVSSKNNRNVAQLSQSVLHPLLHKNTSTLFKQRFQTTFSGEEFFLRDHRVNDQATLPGVAYLEMVRAAIAHGHDQKIIKNLRIQNVIWVAPFFCSNESSIHIDLYPEINGTINFKIYSDVKEKDVVSEASTVVVHCQGRAELIGQELLQPLDLISLQAQCLVGELDHYQCYSLLSATGIHYGPAHRALSHVALGKQHALAEISLPEGLDEGFSEYVLHPSLLDAAFQATIGLIKDLFAGQEIEAFIPFEVEQVNIIQGCSNKMWAFIRCLQDLSSLSMQHVALHGLKFDIDLCDNNGNICIQLKNFVCRKLSKISRSNTTKPLLIERQWSIKDLPLQVNAAEADIHWVILCGASDAQHTAVEMELRSRSKIQISCRLLPNVHNEIALNFEEYAQSIFIELKQLFADHKQRKIVLQVVYSDDKRNLYPGLLGLLKTFRLENPQFFGQLISLPGWINASDVAMKILANSSCIDDDYIRYLDHPDKNMQQRYTSSLKEITSRGIEIRKPWRDDGVYLITGGLGGVGKIFSREIAAQSKRATVVLTGRSMLDSEKQMQLQAFNELGIKAIYLCCDVSDKNSVFSTVQKVIETFGTLNGVIHSAAVIKDNYIQNKNSNEFVEVLRPKVLGVENLDQATSLLELDFFMVFSSLVAIIGNAGQADYACANAFMDEYSAYRALRVAQGQCYGKTISINWPQWQDGGMNVHKSTEMLIERTIGLSPIKTQDALQSLYQAFALEKTQVIIAEGDHKKIKKTLRIHSNDFLQEHSSLAAKHEAPVSRVSAGESVVDSIRKKLKGHVSDLLKVDINAIDMEAELNEFGFDSISLVEFTNRINQEYKLEITPTIFFEHPTLEGITQHLVGEHKLPLVLDSREILLDNDTKISPKTPAIADVQKNESAKMLPSGVSLREKILNIIAKQVSDLLNINRADVDVEAELGEFGFDSISFVEFANRLNQAYNLELTPAIFFEYPALNEIAEFLTNEYSEHFYDLIDQPGIATESVIETETSEGLQYSAENHSLITESLESSIDNKLFVDEYESSNYRILFEPADVKPKSFNYKDDAIAIIGMSGQFPQSIDIDQLWINLVEGKDCIEELPMDRPGRHLYFGDPLTDDKITALKWGGFIEGIYDFDPGFFNISPGEAELMDPHQRLLMQHSWKAIEDAGYAPKKISSNTGVFLGTGTSGYSGLIDNEGIKPDGFGAIGRIPSIGTSRISHFLDLNGPSEPIETACSSALVAIHRGISSIKNNECDIAIVGGVNAIISPKVHISYAKAGMLSPDGRCKTFSDNANGYVRGEGVGVLVLKSLNAAERDNDQIYGIVRSSAVNHGGRANSLTAPNLKAQSALLIKAYENANIDPRTVTYIEAHGTGTALGDPIEVDALKSAFAHLYNSRGIKDDIPNQNCGLGSIKTNIGHLELAAGVAGVIKVLLQIKHQTLVKNLHCDTINPYIDLKNSPFYVVKENTHWQAQKDSNGKLQPRRAGVSSFGIGGVNAHVVIEEYIKKEQGIVHQKIHTPSSMVVLSAKTPERLKVQALSLYKKTQQKQWNDHDLDSIAYTSQIGREAMEHRLAIVVDSIDQLSKKLKAFIDDTHNIDSLYVGHVNSGRDSIGVISQDDDMRNAILKWMESRKLDKLASLWVKGLEFNWENLYGEVKPQRINLPTYSFNKNSYYTAGLDLNLSSLTLSGFKHPLLQKKVSDIKLREGGSEIFDNDLNFVGQQNYRQKLIKLPTYPFSKQLYWIGEKPVHVQLQSEILDCIYAASDWVVDESLAYLSVPANYAKQHIVFCGISKRKMNGLREAMPGCKCVELSASTEDTADRYLEYSSHFLNYVNSIFKESQKEKILIQLVVPDTPEYRFMAGLLGMLKSIHQENKNIQGQIVFVPKVSNVQQLVTMITESSNQHDEMLLKCHRGQRYVLRWKNIDVSSVNPPHVFKDQGVYLITGGMGGLGLIFANEILTVCKGATVVLVGRSELTEEKANVFKSLQSEKGQLDYQKVDVSCIDEVTKLIEYINYKYKSLNGIIHAAGVLHDSLHENKNVDELQKVMAPKVKGAVNLDLVCADLDLDFFVLFSSVVGVFGNVAQADYAAANGFLDQFAVFRNQLVALQDRRGKTLSINWPLWKQGGMGVDHVTQAMLLQNYGVVAMETGIGLKAFYQAMASQHEQVLIMTGNSSKLKSIIFGEEKSGGRSITLDEEGSPATPTDVVNLIAELAAIKPSDISLLDSLPSLGFSSILLMELRNNLTKKYDVPFHVSELLAVDTVQQCIDLVVNETKSWSERNKKGHQKPNHELIEGQAIAQKLVIEHEKIQKMVFLLSAPRSGSTIFRLMLNASVDLFSPPELYLMDYQGMGQRMKHLQSLSPALSEGLLDAMSQATNDDVDTIRNRIAHYESVDESVNTLYRLLQENINGRLLVDKTPSYGQSMETLSRAESSVSGAIYLCLYRHPLSMIGSFVDNRFDKMLGMSGDAWKIAEDIWYRTYKNIQTFCESIPQERRLYICYEALVTQPEKVMRDVCAFLGIDYSENMCHPYDSVKNQNYGLHNNSKMVGDPNIRLHSSIDPALADQWKKYEDRWDLLTEQTRALAETLGYSKNGWVNTYKTYPEITINQLNYGLKKIKFSDVEMASDKKVKDVIVFFPPIFGDLTAYTSLFAALDKDLPIIGFNSEHYWDNQPAASLDEIGDFFSEQLLMFSKNEEKNHRLKLHFVGFSFGGILAYETLRQLQIKGGHIGSLLLIDSACPNNDFYRDMDFGQSDNHSLILNVGLNGFLKSQSIFLTKEEALNLDSIKESDLLTKEIVAIARKHGLTGSDSGYLNWFENSIGIIQEHQKVLKEYVLKPLSNANAVKCFYFRRNDWSQMYQIAENTPPSLASVYAYINQYYAQQDPVEAWRLVLPNIEWQSSSANCHYDMLSSRESVFHISQIIHDAIEISTEGVVYE